LYHYELEQEGGYYYVRGNQKRDVLYQQDEEPFERTKGSLVAGQAETEELYESKE
jgi:hypothetical protein